MITVYNTLLISGSHFDSKGEVKKRVQNERVQNGILYSAIGIKIVKYGFTP